MTIAMDKLFDAELTGAEVGLVIRTLRLRRIDAERQRDSNLRFAAEIAELPGDESRRAMRQQFYQDMADDASDEIAALTALLDKLVVTDLETRVSVKTSDLT